MKTEGGSGGGLKESEGEWEEGGRRNKGKRRRREGVHGEEKEDTWPGAVVVENGV